MKRGACPGVFEPMASGDGLLVRIKPPLGRITAPQLRAVADAARRHGNGGIGVTARGNLQVRGLADRGVAAFAEAMVACGLALADPAAERRRRVIAAPIGSEPAAAIEQALLADVTLDALPDKFVVLAGGGGAADITVRAGRTWIAGATRAVTGHPEDAVLRLAHVLLERRGTRMRNLVETLGADAVYAAAGLVAAAPIPPDPGPRLGLIAPGLIAAGLWCGETDADAVAQLAGIAETCGDGTLRTAPRAVVFPGIVDVPGLHRALALAHFSHDRHRAGADKHRPDSVSAPAGLILDEADPRRLVTACAGRPRCAQATVETRRDAMAFLSLGRRIHISGCDKGCAHPGRSDVTLVGRAGAYDLVLAGSTADAPVARGLTVDDVLGWLP